MPGGGVGLDATRGVVLIDVVVAAAAAAADESDAALNICCVFLMNLVVN
jgi:hypothetical protein